MGIQALWLSVERFFALGGVVMWPLLAVGFLLWYFIALRLYTLRRGVRGEVDAALERALQGKRTDIEADDQSGNIRAAGLLGRAVRDLQALFRRTGRAPHGGVTLDEVETVLRAHRTQTAQHAKLINTLVALAPLLGLLGTVHGMIETFRSLQGMALFARSGGISGGISEALVTTQMGLGLAIPGLLAARAIERRAQALRAELDMLAGAAGRRTATANSISVRREAAREVVNA
jgi:biopolymer transport protein ExbB